MLPTLFLRNDANVWQTFIYGNPLDLIVKPSNSSSALELFKDGFGAFYFTTDLSLVSTATSLPCTINITFIR